MTSLQEDLADRGRVLPDHLRLDPDPVLYSPVKEPNYIVGSGPDTQVLVGGLLEIIVALAGIGTAVTLYPVVKRQNQGVALGFVAIRTLEAATIFAGVVSLLSMVTLRQAGAGPDALVTGQALAAQYNWTFLARTSPPAGHQRAAAGLPDVQVPPRPPRPSGARPHRSPHPLRLRRRKVLRCLRRGCPSGPALGALPIAVWEFSLGVYLTVKGFKPCAITAEITAEATPKQARLKVATALPWPSPVARRRSAATARTKPCNHHDTDARIRCRKTSRVTAHSNSIVAPFTNSGPRRE